MNNYLILIFLIIFIIIISYLLYKNSKLTNEIKKYNIIINHLKDILNSDLIAVNDNKIYNTFNHLKEKGVEIRSRDYKNNTRHRKPATLCFKIDENFVVSYKNVLSFLNNFHLLINCTENELKDRVKDYTYKEL